MGGWKTNTGGLCWQAATGGCTSSCCTACVPTTASAAASPVAAVLSILSAAGQALKVCILLAAQGGDTLSTTYPVQVTNRALASTPFRSTVGAAALHERGCCWQLGVDAARVAVLNWGAVAGVAVPAIDYWQMVVSVRGSAWVA